jgi:hypothetical protein
MGAKIEQGLFSIGIEEERAEGSSPKFQLWDCISVPMSHGDLARNPMKSRLAILIALLVLLWLTFNTPLSAATRKRTITVRFDYDFKLSPACSTTTTKKCLKLFNVYDITARKREWLFSEPIPAQACGFIKGITVSSPPLPLVPGKHVLAVSARSANDAESETNVCTTKVQVHGPAGALRSPQ